MARIVGIHGVAQQLFGPETLAQNWRVALRDGMRLAGAGDADLPQHDEIKVAFYGDLFRCDIDKGQNDPLELADIDHEFECDLLGAWAKAAGLDKEADDLGRPNKGGRAPQIVQRLAVALLNIPFFVPLADRFLVGALKQARLYLTDPKVRAAARSRLAPLITPDTRLVIGHSLGSVVAYEVLCRAPPPVRPAFITLGSPLGLPNLVFDRLDPAPVARRGAWPGQVASWTNIAAGNDVVASVKSLAPLFAGMIEDVLVDNETKAHDVEPYFTARATGAAVLKALRGA